jgi:hypothetical protein
VVDCYQGWNIRVKAHIPVDASASGHIYHEAKQRGYAQSLLHIPAVAQLFTAEEQRHARDLARFLQLNGIALLKTTFPDRVFRRFRHLFGGLEISIGVLITAEIIAKVYYGALYHATKSSILRTLCDQILSDEIKHVEFQAEQLGKLRGRRNRFFLWITMGMQRFLY